MDCSTCGRHFPLSLKNRYEKHLYLCQKFEEHIQIIDHGLLVCRICDNDYETQEKIFRHISQAHFNTEKAAKKAKKRLFAKIDMPILSPIGLFRNETP